MKKVLLVDDEPLLREGLGRILEIAGYLVIEAGDGIQALEKAFSEHPDIIVLDVSMPVMNGMQVLIRLRENPATEAIPVILLSGYPEKLRAGATFAHTQQISKPWHPGAIETAISNALHQGETVTGK